MKRKKVSIWLFSALIIFIISFYFFIFSGIPGSLSIVKGNESTFILDLPLNLYVQGREGSNLELNGKEISNNHLKLESGSPLVVRGKSIGKSSLEFKLFGFIPIRSITVNVLPDVDVYPGGQAIGVLLRSKGVMVVGKSYVDGKDGHRYYPAQEAGINVGDVILAINGEEVNDKNTLASKIQQLANKNTHLILRIKNNGQIKNVRVKPVKNKQGLYMIGLYVEDGVAGVGTLTFYLPKTREYGALGHVITENNSHQKIELREGRIIEAQISGINSGKRGTPGEKLGTFFQTKDILGQINSNTEFGIYGTLNNLPQNPYFEKPIPVATISQVKVGPAKMYTVVKGGKVEEFDVHIDRVYRQSYPDSKGLVVSITDSRLKKITGGIVQGMSGSPIVQNNKLVGAVTHVFVNEPTKGYGVFAEWMILQTETYNKARTQAK